RERDRERERERARERERCTVQLNESRRENVLCVTAVRDAAVLKNDPLSAWGSAVAIVLHLNTQTHTHTHAC
ncbi:hypothetical protein AAFF_G00186660, partial [Aldrovandia affinis]